jgi:hypothetical protein
MPKKTVFTLIVLGLCAWALYVLYPRDRFDPVADARFVIQEQIWNELGRGSQVTCEPPETNETGQTFTCQATVSGGTSFTFDVSIVEGPAVTTALDTLG